MSFLLIMNISDELKKHLSALGKKGGLISSQKRWEGHIKQTASEKRKKKAEYMREYRKR
jgi:hypothetical protein